MNRALLLALALLVAAAAPAAVGAAVPRAHAACAPADSPVREPASVSAGAPLPGIFVHCESVAPPAMEPGYDLVIVMDDLGYNLGRAERVMALPAAITLGLLPFAPATAAIARRAAETGHETILHQPMEPLLASAARAQEGTLTLDMTAERFEAQIAAALGSVPGIVGLNNHTGSRLTQDPESMRRLMRQLAARDLVFLDSRTTAATVAYSMAREARVPALKRDVFLDHDPHPRAIAAAFDQALLIARTRGHAVIIAHPHEASLAFLERALGNLPGDIRVVEVRDLAIRRYPATLAQHGNPAIRHRSLGR